ncbi:MAG TPA: 2-oxoacid:acceptor oxidoreductase family protein [Myxococcota bacterium]|nr:2-oxoacid:acceptor oxidoreductase family protein [Myxococcota bacterium]HRY96812.1 2-oxoacid:acceptor oxidoreductase family protein [Myxococcota bacterium]
MASTEVMMAGFGGQGMLLSGKLLAYAAMQEGKEVSWLPSYGPEMRGGTANVTVVISDTPVGSPYIVAPRALLVMNQPSLEKFGPRVKPGGVIVVNTSLVPIRLERPDCQVLYLPAAELAKQAGTARAANLVMLGAYVGLTGVVDTQVCVHMIEHEFEKKPKFIPANVAAYQAGYDAGLQARPA